MTKPKKKLRTGIAPQEGGVSPYLDALDQINSAHGTEDYALDGTPPPSPDNPFRIRVNFVKFVRKTPKASFKLTKSEIDALPKGPRMGRFTLSWAYDYAFEGKTLHLGQSLSGCLMEVRAGKLFWNPPASKVFHVYMFTTTCSEDLWYLVLRALYDTPEAKELLEEWHIEDLAKNSNSYTDIL